MLIVLAFAGAAAADWRPYTFSYGYMTASKGEREIEFYTDYDEKGTVYNLKNQLEFEYGITEHWMASIYGVFSGSNTKPYGFSQTKFQTRYRFGELGRYIVDPALYFEYKMGVDGTRALEIKEILSKDFGEWNITTNIVLEKELSSSKDWDKGYTLGVSRMLSESTRGGFEAKGSLKGDNSELYIGPSFAMIGENLKMNIAAGLGATTASKSFIFRNIISYEF